MASLWQRDGDLPAFERLKGDVKTDVLIIGGGIAGILCARALAEAGIDSLLVERKTLCSGITKDTTAKITSQHGLIYSRLVETFGVERARMYLMANEAALDRFRTLCRGVDCGFMETDAAVYSLRSREKIERELRALDRIGFRAEMIDRPPLPFPVRGAVRFRNQAQFHPLKFLRAMTEGLRIYEHTPVIRLGAHRAVTDGGSVAAEKIIVATHFPFLDRHGSYFIKMYQERSYVLALCGAPHIDGMYVDEASGGLSFRNAEGLMLLGGGGHRTGKPGGCYRALSDIAKRYYPGAREVCRWATQDCMTLDGVPYIGRYSKSAPDLYVATGFNKWGMTTSMAAAIILADLVCGKENPYAEVFSPSRSILRPQLFINALEAASNLLTPSKKRCPHLGCALKWNAEERTWDCPCHGSRFSKDGKLLDNPAADDLK